MYYIVTYDDFAINRDIANNHIFNHNRSYGTYNNIEVIQEMFQCLLIICLLNSIQEL